jgi:hypothetical protein
MSMQLMSMQLEFVPVEEFYFALTLSVKTLVEFGNSELVEQVRGQLAAQYGLPSTIAAAQQNTFNYVFRVHGHDNSPAENLMVSIADWQGQLRLGSDYGWVLDEQRRAVRSDKFAQRQQFAQELRLYLQERLHLPLAEGL